MWSGPRSISTAMMRSFENRPDTFVSDEPFYAHYLSETGEDHPYCKKIILKGETNWDKIAANITGDIPNGKQIWFQKHMAHHNLPGKDLKWIDEIRNILLIRNPKEVILSYTKKNEIKNILQLGYFQQIELFILLKESIFGTPIIIDSRDVLRDPERMLKELCSRLDIPFYKEMLIWPVGRRESDGIWGKYWYGRVERSSGFHKYVEKTDPLPSKLDRIFEICMEYYQQLYQHRMRVI